MPALQRDRAVQTEYSLNEAILVLGHQVEEVVAIIRSAWNGFGSVTPAELEAARGVLEMFREGLEMGATYSQLCKSFSYITLCIFFMYDVILNTMFFLQLLRIMRLLLPKLMGDQP